MPERDFDELPAVVLAAVARVLVERVDEVPLDFEADVLGFARLADVFERVVGFLAVDLADVFAVAVADRLFLPVDVLAVLLAAVELAVVDDLLRVEPVPVVFDALEDVVRFEVEVDFDDLAVVGRAEVLVRARVVDLAADDLEVDDFPLPAAVAGLAEAVVRDFEVRPDFVPVEDFAAVALLAEVFRAVVRVRVELPDDLRVEVLVELAIPWTP
ncbi:hypothetical protein [Maioricimonas sp. JC845]|uniref:hypothetical protein n=1 Tax=Maioricimonas sp. JC845 TaxID=3232138 RepID=UPI0034587666